ncbi:hypothetical protein BCR35DRAFT_302527 [Leucosporidium creatinivorum]|uniref:Uncharacterized protein n=1 Tax=Leucosporidium creatinivorum TaxID=106004 RepID=A0A1Y2FPM7_9BASI|nr:hypothetical protein BCR35DRAFT_302527 [Leucosporidium creatinivorum]
MDPDKEPPPYAPPAYEPEPPPPAEHNNESSSFPKDKKAPVEQQADTTFRPQASTSSAPLDLSINAGGDPLCFHVYKSGGFLSLDDVVTGEDKTTPLYYLRFPRTLSPRWNLTLHRGDSNGPLLCTITKGAWNANKLLTFAESEGGREYPSTSPRCSAEVASLSLIRTATSGPETAYSRPTGPFASTSRGSRDSSLWLSGRTLQQALAKTASCSSTRPSFTWST